MSMGNTVEKETEEEEEVDLNIESSVDNLFLLDLSCIEITDEDIEWMVGDTDLPPASLYYIFEIDIDYISLDELSDIGVVSDFETDDSS